MKKMVAREGIKNPCHPLTPLLSPLSFSLYTSSLLTHCSACFSPLPLPLQNPPSLLLYCSSQCSFSDSPLHLSSAEYYLLASQEQVDTSDLRAALRLLRYFEINSVDVSSGRGAERIGGLLTNRRKLMFSEQGDDNEVLARIRDGARAMANARRMRDGLDLDVVGECEIEETVLCIVLTNAVEVQVTLGSGIGIAVYDVAFSWINHSCSPNACYRLSLQQSSCESQMLIVPASHDEVETTKIIDFDEFRPKTGENYGPKIVVQCIKVIDKGDEIFITYTDLLQPKAMRQSELWSKYRFICSCRRCFACPPSYVDRRLQEIFTVNCESGLLSSDYEDEASERFTVHVDDAIDEYLMYNNPKSCCKKLEKLLINGILDEHLESNGAKSEHHFFLHPLHHLSLNAYMTLSSAYKTQANDLLNSHPNAQNEAFNMYRISAAYTLLLTCAIHYLFLYESSIIMSVANFWTEAGKSLLNLAGKTMCNSSQNLGPTTEMLKFLHQFSNYTPGSRAASKEVFDKLSREFLEIVTDTLPKVWPFLVHKGCYLNMIKDPLDFTWIGNIDSKTLLGNKDNLNVAVIDSCDSRFGALVCSEQEKLSFFQLGICCLVYGDYLLSTFCGESSYFESIHNISLVNPSHRSIELLGLHSSLYSIFNFRVRRKMLSLSHIYWNSASGSRPANMCFQKILSVFRLPHRYRVKIFCLLLNILLHSL